MNDLFESPLGGLLARPWVDQVGLMGARRWLFPLSRLWAAANVAGEDVVRFREEIGGPLPAFWSAGRLHGLLVRHARARRAAETARAAWEASVFGDAAGAADPARLDRTRREAASRHLTTRALFYPLLFPRRPVLARWSISPPAAMALAKPDRLHAISVDPGSIAVSHPVVREGLREYWLRAPTSFAPLGRRPGSEQLYARVTEPVDGMAVATLVFGSGLCLESDLTTTGPDPGKRLGGRGWRVIEPVSPYHGLRAMPGFYGGEPFFALAPASTLDLIAGQAIESALLIAWARDRFGGKAALAGVSMTSFVAQHAAIHCRHWPAEARPDAVMLISHSGRIEDVVFRGALADALELPRQLRSGGWSRESLAEICAVVDPTPQPAMPPERIVSVLGETDRWLPYEHGRDLVDRWHIPAANVFRYPLGHLGMPVQLVRDPAPFDRLKQVLLTS